MGTPKHREIVEFAGIKTYFFPNLALYAACNENILKNRPENANPVAAYIFGATKVKPDDQEILNIILTNNADSETLFTGMDACLALGMTSDFKYAVNHLKSLRTTHDLTEAIDNPKQLALLRRKSRLQKGISAKILGILVKILIADDPGKKFDEICELCSLDLDFDAFVLIKLLGLDTVDNMEEVEIIKENFMENMVPGLVELMKHGPQDDIIRLLTTYPIEESAQKLVLHYANLYKSILSLDQEYLDSESEIEKSRLKYRLIFLLSRGIASGKIHVARQMLFWIPMEIRREMFPGLQYNRVEKAMEFADSVMKNSKDAILPEMHDFLENPWSRRAIINILDSFRFSISHQIFDIHVELNPTATIHDNTDLGEKMKLAFRHATWIIENYSKEMIIEVGSTVSVPSSVNTEEEKMYKKLTGWVDSSASGTIEFEGTQELSEPEDVPEVLEEVAKKLGEISPDWVEEKVPKKCILKIQTNVKSTPREKDWLGDQVRYPGLL